ncbi:MAG: helix-turn-helix domain-containing protein [Muribaculaceae bacterium]|nr:helix-turn-helix domain-containing protein [Muribaculaceae bacterium]
MKRYITTLILVAASAIASLAMTAFDPDGLRWFNYTVSSEESTVFDIFRDSSGRTWLGSNSGIYRFDGYQAYPATDRQYGHIFRAQVYDMVEIDGLIYAGTNDGLFCLDPSSATISKADGNFPREIRSLLYQPSGNLWIGSLAGLYTWNIKTGNIDNHTQHLPHHAVYSLLEASDGNIYIGTYDGLASYSLSTGKFATVDLDSPAAPGGNIFVNTMTEDRSSGLLYLGTEGALLTLDTTTGQTGRISACDGNSVKSIALDGSRPVAGTDNGLFLFADGPAKAPTVFRHTSLSPYSIASNAIWNLFIDSIGEIWCATDAGVSIIDPASPVRIYSIAALTGRSAGQKVYAMLRDSSDALWIGGSNGLIRLDGDNADWYMPGTEHNLSHNRVRDILETSSGDIFVATDGGINQYDARTRRFRNHRLTDHSRRLNANWAYSIVEDRTDSSLWVAGYLGGIFSEKEARFLSEGQDHEVDTVLSASSGALPGDLIGKMVQDGRHNKWVLHFRDSALTRIAAHSNTVSRIDIKNPTGEEPSELCTDPTGDIWCAFYGGLVRISPEGAVSDTIVRFPFGTGDESVRAMCAVGRDIWVATTGAVFAVDTRSAAVRVLSLPAKSYTAIYYDRTRRQVILGASDELVVADPIRLLEERADESVAELRISEGDMHGIIDFTAHHSDPSRVAIRADNHNIEINIIPGFFSPGQYLRFCYRDESEEQWHLMPEGDNCIRLTTLPPGRHTQFMAVAGAPGSVRSITLDVARPWYQSKLAITLYLLLFISIIMLIIREGQRRQRRRVEEMERTNVLATVENRLFFLANISHELKTPLSMIIGPLSKIRTGEDSAEMMHDVDTAYQNALKLNTLIHQTVELNRMELHSENMLIYSRIDVVEFCRDIFDNYRRSTSGRNFIFTSAQPHVYARIDAVKLESLLSNLLSNAVKYTADGSTIALLIATDGSDFTVTVSDDGVGIPEDEQSLVFQRLYRSPRTAASHEGTGIGLYLVQQYARLLGGSITLSSRVDQGSTFALRLPIGETADENDTPTQHDTPTNPADKRPRVLIVDDNRSIASFISSVLSDDYNCAIASNGKAGLTVASSFRPDLIIADEMMPLMSGLEMSRRLKSNPATAGTPILLLTAKDTPGMHGESIESGVDAFMPKPFEAPVLAAKVRQLIESGENMRRTLRLNTLTTPGGTDSAENPAAASEKQLAAVTTVIEDNLSNPDLNVDFLCRATGMQQKNLYRLLKKYVGVSPVDYIRQTRLRKAAMLLEQKKFSVSEVMYMVGFSSSSYFSKCFAALFGCTPGRYPDGGSDEKTPE